MKCPDCGHISEKALLKCSSCGEVFDRESLETLHHHEYLVDWINKQESEIDPHAYAHLSEEAQEQLNSIRADVLPSRVTPVQELAPPVEAIALPGTQAEIAVELVFIQAVLDLSPTWTDVPVVSHWGVDILQKHLTTYAEALKTALDEGALPVKTPSTLDVINYAIENLHTWGDAVDLHWQDLEALEDYLKREHAALLEPAPASIIEAPPPEMPERPPAPEPLLPEIDWAKWWERTLEFVVSGALLRGLLYLGAFMIVVSAAVLVVRFWNIIPSALQLIFIASVPTVFYLTGWAVRTKLKLLQAGTVLTGIGALLVAVDFAAFYQFGGLSELVDVTPYWLVASLVCTAIYSISAWRLPMEFFGYILLVGGGSTLLAFTHLLSFPLEWQIVTMAASVLVIVEGASRLGRAADQWSSLVRSGQRFSLFLLIMSITLVLFIPGYAALGQFVTFLFVSLDFGLLAWRFPHKVYAHATVWSSIGAFAFVFRLTGLPVEWYGTAVGGLTILYILAEQWLRQRSPEDTMLRESFLDAMKLSNWVLLVVVVLLGFVTLTINLWAGVLALTLATLILGWCARIYHKPILVLAAGGLFVAPVSLCLYQLLIDFNVPQIGAWLMAGWAGLALAYVGLAAILRKAEGYASWLNLLAHILAPLATVGLLTNFLALIDTWFNVPTLVALGGVFFVYAASAVIHDSGRYPGLSKYLTQLPERLERTIFLWPLGFLLPVWISIAWTGSILQRPWLGPALAGLGSVYLGLGEVLKKRKRDYRLPLQVYAYLLAIAGVLVAFQDRWTAVLALTLSSLILGWSARLNQKPILVLAAGGLFVAPVSLCLYQLLIDFNVPQIGAWLMAGWAGLALAYLGMAAALRKAEEYASWLNLLVHALAPAASIGLLLNFIATEVTWFNRPTLVVLGEVIFIYAVSAVVHDSGHHPALSDYLTKLPKKLARTFFLWPLGFLLPVWITIAWTGSILQLPWLGPALAGLGLAYVGLGEVLKKRKNDYRLPLHVYAYPLSVAGILVAFGDKWALLTALYLVVAVFTALALSYRRVGETALAALLFLWPFQLSLELSPLAPHAYSLAYALLACLGYIPLGLMLDKTDRKFALPEYIIGYAVSAYAMVTSLLGRFGVYAMDVPWIAVATPLIISGLLVYSTVRFKSATFTWAAVVTFPIAFGQTLTLYRVLSPYYAVCWVGLAYVYMLVERALAQRRTKREKVWHSLFRLPLGAGTSVLCGLGLFLTASGTMTLFYGRQVDDPFALILAQVFGVGLTVLAAWMYRSRIPLYIASFLSFFPYTSAWIVYGPSLETVQFAWAWTGLATVLLIVGFALDKSKIRYAHAPYLAGYLFAGFSLTWSTPDRLVNSLTMAAVIVLMVLSQVAVHARRHRTFDDFIRFIWRTPGTVAQRAGQMAFLWLATCAFPIWVVQLLTYFEISLAWRGLALALIAPLYIALGLIVKRAKNEYTWPLYGVGYALTAIGAMVAFEDQVLAISVLVINTVIYASSAYIFRQAFWLYLSNTLLPVILMLTLHYNQALNAPWVAGIFMSLAFIYFVVGRLFDRRKEAASEGISPFALPFYIPGYLVSAIALAVASGEKTLAVTIYSAGAAFYALSAWAFRESIFLYPAAWLAAVPYYLAMTLTLLPKDWYGIGWLPLIIICLALGKFVFQKTSLGIKNLRMFLESLTHPAMPFYLLAYSLSVSMMVLSQRNPLALTFAFAAGAIIYLLSAALFRNFAWLYPGLLTAHFSLATLYALRPSAIPMIYITLPFLILTWGIALMGIYFTRRLPVTRQTERGRRIFRLFKREVDFGSWPFVGYLLTPSWSQPFFLFAAADLILWQALAQLNPDTAVVLAVSNALLLGVLAMMWEDSALVYGSLALFLLAVGNRLGWIGVPFVDALAWMGGIGFGFYMLAWIGDSIMTSVQRMARALGVWLKPLENMAILLTASAVLVTLPQIMTYGNAAVSSLAFAGVLYLTIAYRRGHTRLSYLGMAMLELDWVFVMIDQNVTQSQLYAIPAGLYFAFVGHLERRRGRKIYATLVESFGLAVLLVTSFVQSLDGATGFPYFLLLLVEGLVVIWWGIMQQRKIPLFLGFGASALNVVAQVVVLVNVYNVHRWIIILGVGILLVTTAVFVERKREQIITQAQEWREALDTWE